MNIRRATGSAAVVAGLVVLASACGGSSGGSDTVDAGSGSSGSSATVTTHSGPGGAYLTDASGRTLYIFAADTSSHSTCAGDCAKEWPPFTTTGDPGAEGSADDSELGTSARTDGATQVTYAGHPLYYFDEDEATGDMKGQGEDDFGGLWTAVTPSGTAFTSAAPSSSPADDSGSEWG